MSDTEDEEESGSGSEEETGSESGSGSDEGSEDESDDEGAAAEDAAGGAAGALAAVEAIRGLSSMMDASMSRLLLRYPPTSSVLGGTADDGGSDNGSDANLPP
eukprot:CAMPEP_0119469808 /NCGR_PEP_ID=MMETSP1344-20130328/2977_1 /TAXON_ID=236787 /ORGANISM="Florenciella parvula, Strain CCMP2471" /LENGTH=102 /DNA_ID=CAMNT_0007502407 /DNA_START=92 /DNA_END=396 /DNA_ORIENTATION=+